jgi:hypothetical protein
MDSYLSANNIFVKKLSLNMMLEYYLKNELDHYLVMYELIIHRSPLA